MIAIRLTGVTVLMTESQLYFLLILCVVLGGLLLKLYQVEVGSRRKDK